MKLSQAITLVVGVSMVASVHSQVATDSGLQSTTSPAAKPSPSATAEPTVPERAQIDQIFKQTSLGKDADERRLHLEWRELENRVVNDPDIVAAKRAADSARTDLEKRQLLRQYYDLYYGRMRTLASSPEMKAQLEQWRLAHLSRTSQHRVRAEEDANLPSPSPTPKKKEKKSGRLRKFQSNG